MAQSRSSRSRTGSTTDARHRRTEETAVEVTDIIPFNEFGMLTDLDFQHTGAFDTTSRLRYAPELDDLNDTDDVSPLPLGGGPATYYADPADMQYEDLKYEDDPRGEMQSDDERYERTRRIRTGSSGAKHAPAARSRGVHRENSASALKGRLLIAAMAAGAAAAAAHSVVTSDHTQSGPAALTASAEEISSGHVDTTADGVQLITVRAAANPVHHEEFVKAAAFAEERAQREARLQRPLFVMPTNGIPTSGFGYRWGVLHAGIDVANSVGTPIYAVADGVVIDAGPTAGYGMWVKLRHSDGTVTLYGHVNSTLVNIGERVMAGDQIATMGNRGNSTGPHLHFEVMLNGTNRVDPVPWLAERGLSIGG